jgi:hypothetical protein
MLSGVAGFDVTIRMTNRSPSIELSSPMVPGQMYFRFELSNSHDIVSVFLDSR